MTRTGRPAGRPRKITEANLKSELSEADIAKIPPIPNELNEDGQTLWVRIWANAADWLSDVDVFVITELCQIFQDKEFYRRALDLGTVPKTYKLSNKTIVPHPYVGMLKDARAQMNSHFASLGFSPADRARIGAVESMVEDPLVEMVKGKTRREEERERKRRILAGEIAEDGDE